MPGPYGCQLPRWPWGHPPPGRRPGKKNCKKTLQATDNPDLVSRVFAGWH